MTIEPEESRSRRGLLAAVVGRVVKRALQLGRLKTSALLEEFLINVSRKVVWVLGLVLALDMLEINIGPFLAAMGGAAFVIGFALQGTLSNFAAGLMILLYRPFDIGNFVEVAGEKGTVENMSLVSTSLVTPDNKLIIVPNGSIWGGIITNTSAHRRFDCDLKLIIMPVPIGIIAFAEDSLVLLGREIRAMQPMRCSKRKALSIKTRSHHIIRLRQSN